MSVEVTVPAVGESITSGLIGAWLKQEGDAVQAGEALFSLETDKVATEVTSPAAGVLRIKAPAGAEVKIGEVVGLVEEGNGTSPAAPTAPVQTAPLASPPAPMAAPSHTTATVQVPVSKQTAEPPPAAAPAERAPEPVTPAARETTAAAEPAATPPSKPSTDGRVTRRRLSPIRRKIAQQLVMAQQTAAILSTFNECDMSAIMQLRKELQESFVKEHGIKLGFMSFFVKAVVNALKAVPAINSRLEGEELVQHQYYDIGVAIGTERGLVVPVLREADQKSFAQIEQDILDYATKAKEGKIKIEDLQGGVFTISNGGTYGSLLSTPILNPPQSGILGMHKIQERPVAEKGAVVIRPMMYLALSYDHRVVDGKEAVTFLVRVKESLENPARLLLDL